MRKHLHGQLAMERLQKLFKIKILFFAIPQKVVKEKNVYVTATVLSFLLKKTNNRKVVNPTYVVFFHEVFKCLPSPR